MTLFLASVRDAREAEIAIAHGADIIDLKEPEQGALGAVEHAKAKAAIAAVAGRAPVSVTIGDLAFGDPGFRPAFEAAAELCPDVIKIGLFDDLPENGKPLFSIDPGVALVAVVFADRIGSAESAAPSLSETLRRLAAFAFKGVIADTAGKGGGGLTSYWTDRCRAFFVEEAHRHGLFAGLAGSLGRDDIPLIIAPKPDILGFRGALCTGGREGRIDPLRLQSIRAMIPRNGGMAMPVPRRAPVQGEFSGERGSCIMTADQRILAARFLSPHQRLQQPALDKVCVRDLVLPARIGIWSEEQGITQRVRFTVELSVYPIPKPTEDFAYVISYDFIIDGIKQILAEGHVLLAETLAERIAEHCLSDRRAAEVRVVVEKLDRVPGVSLGCEIVRRQKSPEEANIYSLLVRMNEKADPST